MAVISYLNGVSIAELVFYLPALAIAILLTIRHGSGRSSGWIFLIIFTLARIIGACFQLATINDPFNTSLLIGYAVLQNVGLSPLELVGLGLLSRVISSINLSLPTIIRPHHLKVIQLLVLVGLILGIVGGVQASYNLVQSQGSYTPQPLSKASLALLIVAFGLMVLTTIMTSLSVSHAEPGEKRLLLAVALSLPFLLVRLIYSAISLFGNVPDFNSLKGNTTILLCMALIMELATVIIYEAFGLTLRRITAQLQIGSIEGRTERVGRVEQMEQELVPKQPGMGQQIASTLGRKTIIGRLITGQRRG